MTRPRVMLYVGPLEGPDPLGLSRAFTPRRTADGALRYESSSGRRELWAFDDPERAFAFLERRAVDVLLLELRDRPPGQGETGRTQPFDTTAAGRLVARLFPEGEVVAGIQRARVLALVGPDAGGTDAAYRLGQLGVGDVLCAPSWDALHRRLDGLTREVAPGKIAVCLAGGGIEGLLYEIGVLRALDAFFVNRRVEDLDLFCGISAGAVLGAFLANGLGPDEIARAFAGGSARVRAIGKSELFFPNVAEVGARLPVLLSEIARGGVGPRGALSSLSRSVPSGAFSGARLRHYLKHHLEQPGLSNDFRTLRRPLFVGATDQDTSEAVLFGSPGYEHVPIHRAVRASAALVPFYEPEKIDGRWYIDGSFTRTTNMRVAVEQGATMVVLVDPLVPVRSDDPGYVRARGGIFSGMQAVKALINGRFDKAVRAIREMYPEVSFYLFRPHGDEMRVLSGSPMKYFVRREIEELAYRSTLAKVRAAFPELERDFARHGVVFRDPNGPAAPESGRFAPSVGIGI
ncbi:MAG: patatin-like phospholipase family protein [Polyangiales bacterium]